MLLLPWDPWLNNGESNINFVMCLDIIEHTEDEEILLKEIERVLVKGGRFILTTPQKKGVIFPLMRKKRSVAINRSWGHIKLGYDLHELEMLCKNAGLKIKETSTYFNVLTRFIYRFVRS